VHDALGQTSLFRNIHPCLRSSIWIIAPTKTSRLQGNLIDIASLYLDSIRRVGLDLSEVQLVAYSGSAAIVLHMALLAQREYKTSLAGVSLIDFAPTLLDHFFELRDTFQGVEDSAAQVLCALLPIHAAAEADAVLSEDAHFRRVCATLHGLLTHYQSGQDTSNSYVNELMAAGPSTLRTFMDMSNDGKGLERLGGHRSLAKESFNLKHFLDCWKAIQCRECRF
jgi:hypothetical protein